MKSFEEMSQAERDEAMRELILAAQDLPRVEVPTPEWGPAVPKVWVRTLAGHERDAFEASLKVTERNGKEVTDRRNVRARFAVLVVQNESGNQVFQPTDVPALGKKSAKVLDRIWDAAAELSGLTATAIEEAKEELKNGQAYASGSV